MSAPTVHVSTPRGELSCEVHSDPNYPGLTVFWNGRQIAVIEENPMVAGAMRVMTWATEREDPDNVVAILPADGGQS